MAKPRMRQVVANRLGALATALDERIETAMTEASGLGQSDNTALVILGATPGITVRALERQLGLSQSATVRLVDRLQTAGHVVRRDGRDKRELALFLTAFGEECRDRLLAARIAALENVTGDLAKHERRLLLALLGRLLPELTNDGETADHVCRLCDRHNCRRRNCPLLGFEGKDDDDE